ncbi:hypothetical protein GUA87_12325 [Sneathiella sp. P13V-1]|uniref:flagellar assembly protein FliX n=1 Tax=Sneathiella sp. P13V-1 TaxID=2697366 RepID=UPI00187B1BB9|nr:flagellar assembly protein FliX [Sneathiella sp. P13V-1]MBE7637632.1 hypothetical protein [Sneathiella sp. P13V-1]
MRVTGPGRVSTTQKSKGTKSASSAGAKFSIPNQMPEVATPTNVASASPIASVDAIVALQGMDDSVSSNKKALQKGMDILERLEEIRHGLLIGAIPIDGLRNLQATLEQLDSTVEDPKLAEIIKDIEVRAAVELAKLGF